MKTLVAIMSLIGLISCESLGGSKTMKMNIQNQKSVDISGKVYAYNSTQGKVDSISFEVNAGLEEQVNWKKPNLSGDGAFILRIGEQSDSFGYYSNATLLDKDISITVYEDSTVID